MTDNGNGNGSENATVRLKSERMDHGFMDDGLYMACHLSRLSSIRSSCHAVPDPCVMLLMLFCVFSINLPGLNPDLPVFQVNLFRSCHLAEDYI